MASAGEKFLRSLLNAESKFITKHVGYRMEEWDQADTIEMSEALVMVASKRAGTPVTVAELDNMTVEATGELLENTLAKLGFEDDEDESPKAPESE